MSSWNQIVGHEWAVKLLQSAIEHDRIGHAYLITGPDHIGKSTLARIFAQAVNCQESDVPCGVCRACKLIGVGRHMDMRIVTPEVSGRGKLSIKIDTIRQLQQDLTLSAYEAKRKVAIIERFDATTIGAANAFLKTLEEPPKNVVIILTANDADTLLPTIASRCRTINLRPLSVSIIEQSLTTRWHVPEDQAELLAHLSDGRLGWAVRAFEDNAVLEKRDEQLGFLYEALEGDIVRRFALADKLSRKSEQLPLLLQTWLSWWRDAVYLAQQDDINTAVVPFTNIDASEKLRLLVASWPKNVILESLTQTNQALQHIQSNANMRLVVENLFLIYPKVHQLPTPT
ncbi:MAG: DNA polymerase III subunit delta' [Chloroflexota bacterium]